MNVSGQGLMWTYVFIYSRYISRSRFVGWYSDCMFNILRTCQIIFQIGCTILHSHQQRTGVQFPNILTNTDDFLSFNIPLTEPSGFMHSIQLSPENI